MKVTYNGKHFHGGYYVCSDIMLKNMTSMENKREKFQMTLILIKVKVIQMTLILFDSTTLQNLNGQHTHCPSSSWTTVTTQW